MNLHNLEIPVIDVYITGKCNFKCQYCFGEEDSKNHITLDMYERILEFASYAGAKISLTGGEPLLHPLFETIIVNSKKMNIPLFLRTNGMLLSKYVYLCDVFEWIGVSLDGTMDINNIMRPTSIGFEYTASEKLSLPLKSIKDIKNKFPNVKILIATIATSKNLFYLEDMAELFKYKDIPIDLWKIYQFTSNNFRSLLTKNKFEISYKNLYNLEDTIRKKVDFDILFKYGKGNCLLIDTNGDLLINGSKIGNIEENFSLLAKKIKKSKNYELIISNKKSTYGLS